MVMAGISTSEVEKKIGKFITEIEHYRSYAPILADQVINSLEKAQNLISTPDKEDIEETSVMVSGLCRRVSTKWYFPATIRTL